MISVIHTSISAIHASIYIIHAPNYLLTPYNGRMGKTHK